MQSGTHIHHQKTIRTQALTNLNFSHFWPLSSTDEAAVQAEMNRIIYFSGNTVALFNDNLFLTPAENASVEENLKVDAINVLKFLLVGTKFQLSVLNKKSIIDALTVKRDSHILGIIRHEFQKILMNINLETLNQLDEMGQRQFAIQLANMLALYTFLEPHHDQTITFPQLINNRWEQITFIIEPIELKPNKELFPQTYELYADNNDNIHNEDHRLFAFGLIAKDRTNVSPHLLFMGTPPETSQGHLFARLTDFKPNYSVGEELYKSSRESIIAWLKKATLNGTQKCYVSGQSLGGALSLLLVLDAPHYIKRVDAMNAPGLYETTLNDPLFKTWDTITQNMKPTVLVHMQQHDPVKYIGFWKNDWLLLKIYPKAHELFLSSYLAHIRSFANQPDSIGLIVNNRIENGLLVRKMTTYAKQYADQPIRFFTEKQIREKNQIAQLPSATQ